MFMDWRNIYLTIFKGRMLTLLLHTTIWKMVAETPVERGRVYFGME